MKENKMGDFIAGVNRGVNKERVNSLMAHKSFKALQDIGALSAELHILDKAGHDVTHALELLASGFKTINQALEAQLEADGWTRSEIDAAIIIDFNR